MAEFVGMSGVEHVAQPPDSEFCFAAIIAAITGRSVTAAHEALRIANLSDFEGNTPPPTETTELSSSTPIVKIAPFTGYDMSEFITTINSHFGKNTSVAFLYKSKEPEDEKLRWALLVGYYRKDSVASTYEVMDPLETGLISIAPKELESPIGHTTKYKIAKHNGGAYACALTVDCAPSYRKTRVNPLG